MFKIVSMYTHRGPYVQRGQGIGNVFGSIFGKVLPSLRLFGQSVMRNPIARQIGRVLKDQAIQGVKRVAADAIAGKNIGQSFNKNLNHARNKIAKTIESAGEKAPAEVIRPPAKRKPEGVRRRLVVKKIKTGVFPRGAAKSVFAGDESE